MVEKLGFLTVLGLLLLVAKISCNVYTKAGFPKYFGLLIFIPVINFIALYALAFGEWPIEKNHQR